MPAMLTASLIGPQAPGTWVGLGAGCGLPVDGHEGGGLAKETAARTVRACAVIFRESTWADVPDCCISGGVAQWSAYWGS